MFIHLKWTLYIAFKCTLWMSRTLVATGQGVLDTGGKEKSACLTAGDKEKSAVPDRWWQGKSAVSD